MKTFFLLSFISIFNVLIHAQSPLPDAILESNQSFSAYGRCAVIAGDVNGDSFDDVIVGAYRFDDAFIDEGRVHIYHGSADGIISTPATIIDGEETDAHCGTSVSAAGDINGDGYGDVLVGIPAADNGQIDEGVVYVHYGSAAGISATPDVILEVNQAYAQFGQAVANAGDINADGFDDIIIGASAFDNGQTDEGKIFVYLGSASGIATTPIAEMESNQDYSNFGFAVAGVGDINNDGYDDVASGAMEYDNGQEDEGRVFFYYGNASGVNTTPAALRESNQAYAYFGISVSAAGDVNDDGVDDVLVGAYLYDNGQDDEGRVFIWYGNAAGITTAPDLTLESNQDFGFFGRCVSGVGDVNFDGVDDILIGANTYDSGETDEGAAFVFYGETGGLLTTPELYEIDQAYASFGRYMAGAGDINGDGVNDILISCNDYTNGQEEEGGAMIYHGACPLTTYYADSDDDTYGNPDNSRQACIGGLAGYVENNADCDDTNAAINPDAVEIADGLDNNCNGEEDEGITGMSNLSGEVPFFIYPNPASDFLMMESGNGLPKTILLADAAGRVLFTLNTMQSLITLPLSHLPPGIYYITLEHTQGKAMQWFVKQ